MKRLLYLLALGVAAAALGKSPTPVEAQGSCDNSVTCHSAGSDCPTACNGCSAELTGGSGKCFFGAPPIEEG